MMGSVTIDLVKRLVFLLFLFGFALFVYLVLPFVFLSNTSCIVVHPHQRYYQVIDELSLKPAHISPLLFKIIAKVARLDVHLSVGEYCFNRYDSILTIMTKLRYSQREIHKFTFVDGWTYSDMVDHLRVLPALSQISVLDDSTAVHQALDIVEGSLEGQFYPETYYYSYPHTALDILTFAHHAMTKHVDTVYQTAETKPYFKTPYELIIAASIIEKEASDPNEKRLVAGVIVNRMQQHMKLQMDPTVMYGLHLTQLKKQDLKTDSAYNTYMHFGLPPTPICMPGEAAIYAAAHPLKTDFLYYVSKKNGKHQFSKTLEEQSAAIKEYLLSK